MYLVKKIQQDVPVEEILIKTSDEIDINQNDIKKITMSDATRKRILLILIAQNHTQEEAEACIERISEVTS